MWVRRSLIATVGLVLVVGTYIAYWVLMARQSEHGLDMWIAERRAEGIDVAFAKRQLDGFPTRLALRLDGTTVTSAAAGGQTWRWRIPSISAWVAPWQLNHIRFDVTGTQSVSFEYSGSHQNYQIVSTRLGGDVELIGAGRGRLRINLNSLAVENDTKSQGHAQRMDIDLAWRLWPPADEPAEPLHFDLGIDGAELPLAWRTPLGRKLPAFRFSGKLTGPWQGGPLTTALARWRDAGGTIEVSRLAIEHGPLNLDTNGTLALDEMLQPLAAFTARAEGYLGTVDSLVHAGFMQPHHGTAAKLVMTIIAKRPAGQPAFVETPLTFQDRVLSAGEVRLVHLPIIRWQRLQGLVLPGSEETARLGP